MANYTDSRSTKRQQQKSKQEQTRAVSKEENKRMAANLICKSRKNGKSIWPIHSYKNTF
jgi:hypothetical protein